MKKISLTTWILIATIGGIVFGSLVGPWAGNLRFIGDIFIRLIQMSVVLLVMSAVAAALGNASGQSGAGKMGFHMLKWVIGFTVISAFLGLALGMIIRPGEGIDIAGGAATGEATVIEASIQDTLLGFVPTNIVGAMAEGAMVPSILFAIFFGIAMGQYVKSGGNPVILNFIVGLNATIMNIIKIVMKVAPIGIFALLADVSGVVGFAVIGPMILFLSALAIGVVIQMVIYCPFVAAMCKVNPFKMPKKFAKMSIMALTTTSSAICLPTKMEDSVTKFGISRKVTDFTGPITMSINSSGAVMCYVLAILFMSQSTGIVLTGMQLVMAIFLSILMCMGTIVVPGGMVIVYTFLATSMGLPLEAVAILIGIDWFSGMFRTFLNVNVDVLVGLLVSNKIGDFDRDVYNDLKTVEYGPAGT